MNIGGNLFLLDNGVLFLVWFIGLAIEFLLMLMWNFYIIKFVKF